MPSMSNNYEWQCKRLKERAAKLIAKGINPRSLKFTKLLYRL